MGENVLPGAQPGHVPSHLSPASASHSYHFLLSTFQLSLSWAGVCDYGPQAFIGPSYFPPDLKDAIKVSSFILQYKGTKSKQVNLTMLHLQCYFLEEATWTTGRGYVSFVESVLCVLPVSPQRPCPPMNWWSQLALPVTGNTCIRSLNTTPRPGTTWVWPLIHTRGGQLKGAFLCHTLGFTLPS